MPTADEQSNSENSDNETRRPGSEVNCLQSADFAAYEIGKMSEETSTLGVVESVHQEQDVCTVKVMAPTGPGPWRQMQKSWTLSQRDGAPVREQIGFHELIACF